MVGAVMGKLDNLIVLKKVKARAAHRCAECDSRIAPAEHYYKEHVQDRFLHSLHARKFCLTCFQKRGDALLRKG